MTSPKENPIHCGRDLVPASLFFDEEKKVILASDEHEPICAIFALDGTLYFCRPQGRLYRLNHGVNFVLNENGLCIRYDFGGTISFSCDSERPSFRALTSEFRAHEQRDYRKLLQSKETMSPAAVQTIKRGVIGSVVLVLLYGGLQVSRVASCSSVPPDKAATGR